MSWFVLNHIASGGGRHSSAASAIDAFNRWNRSSLELFAPTMVKVSVKDGRHVMSDAPLTFHYVFVKGEIDDVKRLCAGENGFSLVLNPADPNHRYAIVSDHEMMNFRTVALAYSNQLPFLDLADVDLEAGDLVEIVEGTFPGLRGYYMPRPKSTSGDIILTATSGLGTIVYDIKARYVRVIQFSQQSRRLYDQINAFIPRLMSALRAYYVGEIPARRDLTALTVFTQRMGILKVDNPKLNVKLTTLLWASYIILGNLADATQMSERLERLMPHITSPATRALITLLQAVISRDPVTLQTGYALIDTSYPSADTDSSADARLRAEYHHYLKIMDISI